MSRSSIRGWNMKKVTAFIGSARKKFTYDATRLFLENLKSLGDVEYEIMMLSDHQVGTCRGCKICFVKGEEFCPMKDDRDLLIGKIAASDGVVFATPTYSFQVSGIMKVFLDRLGFVCHRPRYFGKAFTNIVTQGINGGGKIMKYLNYLAMTWGFNTVKGSCHTAFEPMTDKERRKVERALEGHSRRFHEMMLKPGLPPPTLIGIIAFQMSRTSMKNLLDERSRDFTYYRDKGWLESGYYYPVRVGPVLKGVGRLSEAIANRMWPPAKKGKKTGGSHI